MPKQKTRNFIAATVCSLALHCSAFAQTPPAGTGVSAKARDIHQRAVVLDTHLDTPANLPRPGWSIVDRHRFQDDGTQVDYPRMVDGGLDGGFWVIFTGQGPRTREGELQSRDFGLERLGQIREMVAAHPDKFELATVPADAKRIKDAGKRSVYISIENASPLSADPSLLSAYYRQGVRMLGLVHTSNNDFADSSTDANGPEWNGISPKGRELVKQANRLGILIDQSHASDAVFDQLLELSGAPIILSHTAAFDLNGHPRNITDARIRKLAEKGGVIQVNSLSGYLIPTERSPEFQAEMKALYEQSGGRAAMRTMTPADYRALAEKRKAIETRHGIKTASFDDYMRHILHIIEVAGPDHVGLGADWDGGGGVDGLEDVSLLPKITQRLLDAGYNEQQIANIWGNNLLRVLGEAQAKADPVAVKAALGSE